MKRSIYLGSFLILWVVFPAWAGDAGAAEVRKVETFASNGEVRIEITLSAVVTPSVETAKHPDRVVLKLPGTSAAAQQTRIAVGQLGVLSVRYGLNRSDPPETYVVVNLDQEHPYKILTDGTKITLIVQPAQVATASRRTPAGAASRPLLNSIGGSSQTVPASASGSDTVLLTPPPSQLPINFPASAGDAQSANASSSGAGNLPSASRPNRASLQEGTVFPSAGAPGAGVVPPVANGPEAAASNGGASQASASASAQPERAANALPQEPQVSATASPETAASARTDSIASLPQSSGQSAAATPALKPPQAAENSAVDSSPQPAQASVAPAPTPAEEKQSTAANTEPATEAAEGSGSGRAVLPTHQEENADFRTAFRVKYVAQDAAYLDGGRAGGLAEGMKLVVRDLPNAGAVATEGADGNAAGDVAELEVISVAETSAVTEIHTPKRPVKVGDLAYLSSADQQALVEKNALSATRKYPAVVSFTENDTLDEEAREIVPKPPLPSVNRARGRIGFDYIGVVNHNGSAMYTNNLGMVVQADITRINGTYWNISGYWRGRFDHSSGGPQTLQDLINRTYHLYTSYTNPQSSWVMGFGRMYLPWATSLDTIDGGYVGRKVKQGVTAGIFMGSTPDPTSYSYNPNTEIGGAFVNFEGGSYDDLHYYSTSGGGLKMVKWSPDRPFFFFENGIFYKRIFSLYQSAQLDSAPGYYYQTNQTPPTQAYQPGAPFGLGRSFITARFTPHPRVEFSVNQTYFRDLPTFDPNLIGTGLLDKYLMQGFSGGARVEVHKQIWLSADLGTSNRTGDKQNSLNQMYGLTFGHLPWIGLHADARYTRFNNSFGNGSYKAFSLSRNLGETLQFQFLAGQQDFSSSLTSATRSRFLNGMIETSLGPHYFLQAGGTVSRGSQMNYEQWLFTFGYRFDNRHGHRGE